MGLTKIREIMDSRGLTSEKLSHLSNVPKSTIDKIAGGFTDNPKYETVLALARALDCSVDELSNGYESTILPDHPNILPIPKMKKVPRLGAIACGEPALAEQNIEGYDSVPIDIHCDFSLVCKGDSMTGARIMDGDVVFIRQQPDVEDGEIAAVLIGDEASLKRVYHDDGALTLAAANQAYPPRTYSGTKLSEIRILGKAVEFLSRIR